MNPASRIAQIYGYAVCLIAIVTLLIVGSSFVDAAFDLANPLQAANYRYGGYSGGSLTSFEAFRATYRESPAIVRMPEPPGGAPAPADTLTTEELRQRYETLRADRMATVRYGATRDLVKNGLIILLALTLFVTHWRWVRSRI